MPENRGARGRAVELFLFDSGTIDVGEAVVPIPFFLIRHPRGDVLIDGGNPLAVARDPRAHWGALADHVTVYMSAEQHCVAQLRELGITSNSVRYIVQTHLHIDHTGALGHFPKVPVIVHERELQAARQAGPPIDSMYLRDDSDRPELRWQIIDGSCDLFDDGTIRLIETPGHSAGHLSLLVQLKETGTVLLTADAADSRAQWEGQAEPRALFSHDEAARSLDRLRDLARANDALVVLGHEPKDWGTLRHAPQSYS